MLYVCNTQRQIASAGAAPASGAINYSPIKEGEGIKWPEKCGVVCVCLLRKDTVVQRQQEQEEAGWLPLSYIQIDLQLH